MILLRHVWEQVRQDRLFSSIYIIGVALAIATTMIFGIIYYVKLAPVYPEYNRANTYFVTHSIYTNPNNGKQSSAFLSYRAIKELLYPLKNCELVAAEYSYSGDSFIQPTDGSGDFKVKVRAIDPEFFKLYNYKFLEGAPLTEADHASGTHNAVITEGLAARIFGTHTDIVGRTFSLDHIEYRVSGVIKDPSALTPDSFGHVFMLYSSIPGYDESRWMEYLGYFKAYILLSSDTDPIDMGTELYYATQKYTATFAGTDLEGYIYHNGYCPISYYTNVFYNPRQAFSWSNIIRTYSIALLVLLLVPALNLSGIIAGRMENRMPEIGVRQSFGATRRRLLILVLGENLILTIAGGILGLILAWIGIYWSKEWIFTLFESMPILSDVTTSGSILTSDMLFTPVIFIAAFAICLILNLLAALIPAWWALRHPITESLNQKR